MCYVVIAAYNESSQIGLVIDQIKKAGYKVIVVDDGSRDDTYKIAKKHGAIVLKHIVNRGQGAALQTGIKRALTMRAKIIVTFDADGQFLVNEIKRVIKPIKEGKVDIVLGSRFLGNTKNIPMLKKIVLKLGIIYVKVLYRIKITDSQNGFRAMSRYAASQIKIKTDKMEHAGEIMNEIVRNNLKYKEVPVTVLYTEYSLKRGQNWTRSFNLGIRMLFRKFMR